MKAKTDFPETLHEAIRYFTDEDVAFEFMKKVRWPDGVVKCPQCDASDVSFISTRKKWTCKHCTTRKQFTIRVGTILEDSPIGFDKWICGFWLIANAKNGISSYEVGRALGVTQRSGWFMLQRIRLALQNGTIVKMGGTVEADETYIGGKARNMHKGKRKVQGSGAVAMTPVHGLLERGTKEKPSRVALKVLQSAKKGEVQSRVREYVLRGSNLNTDALKSYRGLADEYVHEFIDHAETYVRGHVHTNGLENFWSLLKRCIKGTYVSVEPFHLFRYLDEQAFRFNERKNEDGDMGRFLLAIAGMVGKRLTWKKLVGEGESASDGLPAIA